MSDTNPRFSNLNKCPIKIQQEHILEENYATKYDQRQCIDEEIVQLLKWKKLWWSG